MASSHPPPSAKPLTAATTGFGDVSKRRNTSCPRRASRLAMTGELVAISEMSAPATKARPAPVRITPPTSSRSRASSIASPSSVMTVAFSALSLSGRLTVMTAIRSATSRVSVVRDIAGEGGRSRPGGARDDSQPDRDLPLGTLAMAQQWILRTGTKRSGFRYMTSGGKAVAAPATLARIDALRIPPAWTEVHVAPSPSAAVQAWGFDAKGRKQYRYHDAAVERGQLRKYYRVRRMAHDLPAIRAAVARDLRGTALGKQRVTAGVVRLIGDGFF